MMRALVLVLCLLSPVAAQAQPDGGGDPLSPVTLRSFSAPSGCPGAEALLEAVRAEIAAAPPSGLAQLDAEVVVERAGEGYRLRLVIAERGSRAGVGSERELRGRRCDQVIEAAALTLVMAMESADTPGDEPIQVVGVSPLPNTGPGPEVVFARSQRRLRPTVQAGLLSEAGFLPGHALGIELGAGGELGRWRGEIGVSYWFERRAEADGAGSDIAVLSAPLRVCGRVLVVRDAASLSACAGLELGVFLARGADVQQAREDTELFVSSPVALAAGMRIAGPWWLRARVGAALLWQRPRFVVLPDTEVYAPSRVSGRFVLSSELHL